ncbi:MAG TPA: hypothetical protein VE981_17390 [Planctomycetota bacterium]|nr:hypothetical protein [Planctomycetota bacterium]
MRPQDSRTLYTISCACGEKCTLDARSFGKPTVCRKCGTQFTVAWGKNSVSQRSAPVRVSLARKRAATPLRLTCTCGYSRSVTAGEAHRQNLCPGCGRIMLVEKPPGPKSKDTGRLIPMSPPPSTPSMPLLPVPSKETPETRIRRLNPSTATPVFNNPGFTCECGREIEAVKALQSGDYSCPSCGRSIRMEKLKSSTSRHTVIRPVFGDKTPPPAVRPPSPPAQPPAPPPRAADLPAAEVVEEALTVSSGYQELFCPCGEALMVGMEDVGKNVQCPTCLTLIAVDVLKDSKTGGSALRVRAIGKMDQDTWSLNDFA